jgi:AcrR family transcriptional regulator
MQVSAATDHPVPDPVVSAALDCIARFGIRKTTLDDVARAAGVSRATLYRQFPGGKRALLDACSVAQVQRLLDDVVAAIDPAANLVDTLTAAITSAARFLIQDPATRTIFETEPELVAPHISFDRATAVFDLATGFLAPHLALHTDHDHAVQLAEWAARVVLSYGLMPSNHLDLTNPDHVLQLVQLQELP